MTKRPTKPALFRDRSEANRFVHELTTASRGVMLACIESADRLPNDRLRLMLCRGVRREFERKCNEANELNHTPEEVAAIDAQLDVLLPTLRGMLDAELVVDLETLEKLMEPDPN